MPIRGLPGNASLEQLHSGAMSLRKAVRAADPGAAAVVREFHPHLAEAIPGSPELAAFTARDAELVVARRFGFPSWARLEAHLALVAPHARSPHAEPDGEHSADGRGPADRFLRLACLTYGGDDPERWRQARELLNADPALVRTSIHAAAAAADLKAARELLRADPALARLEGGPHRWEPLLYLTYSRLAGPPPPSAAAEVARLLLHHGADPNAGYLWEGLSPPFTALTGAFGGGEGSPPPHPECEPLARALLEAGADANDAQTLYNRQGDPDDAWLELLFAFGLGRGDGGPWRRLLGSVQATPVQMLEDQMIAAAHHGFAGRVALLLRHGVDPEGRGTRHPIYEGRTPQQEAALQGHAEAVELLAGAGASSGLDPVHWFLSACMRGDGDEVERLLAEDPTLAGRTIAHSPDQLVRAAERGALAAAGLLTELGFDVNAIKRTAPLHEAAMRGDMAMIELLLAHGADPSLRDRSYDATPAGWAEHHGQAEAQRRLTVAED